jgi:hypothetical protein
LALFPFICEYTIILEREKDKSYNIHPVTQEQGPKQRGVEAHQLAQFSIQISGLKPFSQDKRGRKLNQPNLYDDKVLDQLVDEMQSKPWLRNLFTHAISGHRKGIVGVTIGAAVFTVGMVEFTHRKGKDFRDLKNVAKKIFHHEKKRSIK